MALTLTEHQWQSVASFEQNLATLEDWLSQFSHDDPVREIVIDKIEKLINQYKTKQSNVRHH